MPRSLLLLLGDGLVHATAEIEMFLEISHEDIKMRIGMLESMGVQIYKCANKSAYQLAFPIELLDIQLLRFLLEKKNHFPKIDIQWSIPSTNDYCLNQQKIDDYASLVCLAEHQEEGRGRRGRSWISPLGSNLYMSIYSCFKNDHSALEGLSLAVGLVIADVLANDFGVPNIGLKWPNDILCNNKKLGGILIDIQTSSTGELGVVVGIGLNVRMPRAELAKIDQPNTDIFSVSRPCPSRNILAASIIGAVLDLLQTFELEGFSKYCQRWDKYDVYKNLNILLCVDQRKIIAGKSLGISSAGELMVDIDGIRHIFNAGEVSLRCE